MQHKGEIVKKAVEESGYKIVKLAEQLKRSRRWVYLAFEKPNLSIDYILAIGKIIHHDFYPEINELKKQGRDAKELTVPSIDDESNPGYWKSKYLSLLEDHYLVLRKLEELASDQDAEEGG